ncbi:hypothetical protein [Mesobacillus campisalis]|nr:hypothetical protein [Mesobacillus campisalis]
MRTRPNYENLGIAMKKGLFPHVMCAAKWPDIIFILSLFDVVSQPFT